MIVGLVALTGTACDGQSGDVGSPEVIETTRSALTSGPTKINAGSSSAAAPFIADVDFTGGTPLTRMNTIDLSAVANPAPAAVYQSQRYGDFSYTIPGFGASSTNQVRLHFCDTHFSTAGARTFNVTINGTQVLTKFDIIGTVGAGNKALAKAFLLPANASGQYVIQFTSVVDKATISGIDIGLPELYGAHPGVGYDGPNPSFQGQSNWAPHLVTGSPGARSGAPPLNQITVQPVIWKGSGTGCAKTPTVTFTQMANFYTVFINSSYFRWLQAQYGIPNLLLNAPMTVTTAALPCGATQNIAQVKAAIAGLIKTNSLGVTNAVAKAATTLYAVHFPSDVVISQAECGCHASNDEGFLDAPQTTQPFHFLRFWDYNAADPNYYDSYTMDASHEMAEHLTDAFGKGMGKGWKPHGITYSDATTPGSVDSSGAQIGELCQGLDDRISCVGSACSNNPSVMVQAMWSNVANACLVQSQGAAFDLGVPSGLLGVPPPINGYSGGSGINLIGTGGKTVWGLYSLKSRATNGLALTSSTLDDAGGTFELMATKTNVKAVTGDFNGDGLGDIALVMPSPDCSLPIATRGFKGAPYHVTLGTMLDAPAPSTLVGLVSSLPFGGCFLSDIAAQKPLPPLVGDFNGDGISDIAMIGGNFASTGGWTSIPVSFGAGNTTNDKAGVDPGFDGRINYWQTNNPDVGLNGLIYATYKQMGRPPLAVAADFDGDGLTDIGLVGVVAAGGAVASSVAVALSNGDGTFRFQSVPTVYMTGTSTSASDDPGVWAAAQVGTRAVAGDFNGDGLADIALMNMPGNSSPTWGSIPVLYGSGGFLGSGTQPGPLTNFVIVNRGTTAGADFAAYASAPAMQLVTGDYDGDGVADLALTGASSVQHVVVAFSNATRTSTCTGTNCTTSPSLGLFTEVIESTSTFSSKAGNAGVTALSAGQAR